MKYTIQYQKETIDRFPEPKNDYDRVDYNIECNRLAFHNDKHTLIINLFSMLAIPIFLLIYCFNRLFTRRKMEHLGKTVIIESKNRKGVKYSYSGRLPIFGKEYGEIIIIEDRIFPKFREGIFGVKAFLIFSRFAARHPFDFFNNFRMLVNLMGYNRLLFLYQPYAIVNSRMELNHNSSLISLLCENFSCRFVNYMHGEALYNIRTAFVRFSEFYIWDDYYINVFSWSRCPVDQFKVYQPEIFNRYSNEDSCPEYFITYYFSGNEKLGYDENADIVKQILLKFIAAGKKCKVRPHPRWSDFEKLTNIFLNTEIRVEDPNIVLIEQSIFSTDKVVGTFSTVLMEAFYSNKDIVIDDISNVDVYNSLFELGYILANKPHKLLSQILPR